MRMKKCSGCNQVWYCGKECQLRHWRHHKHVCGSVHKKSDLQYQIFVVRPVDGGYHRVDGTNDRRHTAARELEYPYLHSD